MIEGHGHDHLVFPQGDGVDDGGADLFGHEAVVVLHHADLGRHLHGDHAGQLQIMDLLLKAADHVGKVVGGLSVFGQSGFVGLLHHLGQLDLAQLLDLQLAGQDVHGQLLHVLAVLVVHLVHHADVLEQGDFMPLERFHDLVHVELGLVVLRLERGDALRRFLEQPADTLLLLGVKIQTLELDDQIAEHIADLAEILGAHGGQGGVGELGNVLLGGAAVVHDLLGVHDVDLLGEFLDGSLLGGGQAFKLELCGLDLFGDLLDLGFLNRRFLHGGCRGGGVGIERQEGNTVFFFTHGRNSFL